MFVRLIDTVVDTKNIEGIYLKHEVQDWSIYMTMSTPRLSTFTLIEGLDRKLAEQTLETIFTQIKCAEHQEFSRW